MSQAVSQAVFPGSNLDLESFQNRYWRREAVALGQIDISTLSGLEFPQLLTLAQEDHIESRVIAQLGDDYEVAFGPFEAGQLGPNQMLMVQNLESVLPEVSVWLSDAFGFLPRWRIEDVMATLADDNGNCGPHFDQYDVFLVQVSGHKDWSLDAGQHGDEDLRQDSEIRLLIDFEPTEMLRQTAGDVLYIPPGVGHHGIASDNSLTLSVGIRNPLLTEMASYLADLLLQSPTHSRSLNDRLTGSLIDPAEIASLGHQLAAALTAPELTSSWYGAYMTEPRDPELLEYSDAPADLSEWIAAQDQIKLQLPARIAVQPGNLFINGETIALETCPDWLVDLQQQRSIAADRVSKTDAWLIQALIESGGVVT